MREIKFRAWNIKQNKMVYEGCYVLDVSGFEYMQYTGLKDKNGKEIYEGDIIKTRKENNAEVYFDLEDAWFKFRPSEHTYQWSDLDFGVSDNWDGCEVIGNIYENPELLKGGE